MFVLVIGSVMISYRGHSSKHAPPHEYSGLELNVATYNSNENDGTATIELSFTLTLV